MTGDEGSGRGLASRSIAALVGARGAGGRGGRSGRQRDGELRHRRARRLTWKKGPSYGGVSAPHVTITRSGSVALDQDISARDCSACSFMTGTQSRTTPLSVIDLDGDGEPEVVVDTLQRRRALLLRRPDLSLRQWDLHPRQRLWGDAGVAFKDLDNDGQPELVTVADVFAYACSRRTSTRGCRRSSTSYVGAARSPTSPTSSRALVRKDMANILKQLPKARRAHRDLRGLVAAYVADHDTLGQKSAGVKFLAKERKNGDLRLGRAREGVRDGAREVPQEVRIHARTRACTPSGRCATLGCVALNLITGPANAEKAGAVLDGFRAEVARGSEPLLVVPTLADVDHYRRELAAGGAVFGVADPALRLARRRDRAALRRLRARARRRWNANGSRRRRSTAAELDALARRATRRAGSVSRGRWSSWRASSRSSASTRARFIVALRAVGGRRAGARGLRATSSARCTAATATGSTALGRDDEPLRTARVARRAASSSPAAGVARRSSSTASTS